MANTTDLVTIKHADASPEKDGGKYVIRDVVDSIGITGRCGNVRVEWTFSTNLWFWAGGFFGYLDAGYIRK